MYVVNAVLVVLTNDFDGQTSVEGFVSHGLTGLRSEFLDVKGGLGIH